MTSIFISLTEYEMEDEVQNISYEYNVMFACSWSSGCANMAEVHSVWKTLPIWNRVLRE
jgi:hypothetical protein